MFVKPGEPVGWYKVHAAKTEKTLESREKTRRMTNNNLVLFIEDKCAVKECLNDPP